MNIAGIRSDADWKTREAELLKAGTPELWGKTFDEFLIERVRTRYLEPMRAIAKIGTDEGEGFAIVALFCTLIEFLEGCEQGMNFDKKAKPGEPNKYGLDPNGITGRKLFSDFLKREPLKSLLGTSSPTFYADVRCGLLHEARTCGGWKVRTCGPENVLVEVQGADTILYRDQLESVLNRYFADYRARLVSEKGLQDNFIIKWNHLSQR